MVLDGTLIESDASRESGRMRLAAAARPPPRVSGHGAAVSNWSGPHRWW